MDCPICIDTIDAKSQVVSTPCGHVFHSNCMETWIAQGKKNCPQCRKVCERQNIRPIFLPFSDQENPRAEWYQNELLPWIQNRDLLKWFAMELECSFLQVNWLGFELISFTIFLNFVFCFQELLP